MMHILTKEISKYKKKKKGIHVFKASQKRIPKLPWKECFKLNSLCERFNRARGKKNSIYFAAQGCDTFCLLSQE